MSVSIDALARFSPCAAGLFWSCRSVATPNCVAQGEVNNNGGAVESSRPGDVHPAIASSPGTRSIAACAETSGLSSRPLGLDRWTLTDFALDRCVLQVGLPIQASQLRDSGETNRLGMKLWVSSGLRADSPTLNAQPD